MVTGKAKHQSSASSGRRASRNGTSGLVVTESLAGGSHKVGNSAAAAQLRIVSSKLRMPLAVQPPMDRSLTDPEPFELDTAHSQLIPFDA